MQCWKMFNGCALVLVVRWHTTHLCECRYFASWLDWVHAICTGWFYRQLDCRSLSWHGSCTHKGCLLLDAMPMAVPDFPMLKNCIHFHLHMWCRDSSLCNTVTVSHMCAAAGFASGQI